MMLSWGSAPILASTDPSFSLGSNINTQRRSDRYWYRRVFAQPRHLSSFMLKLLKCASSDLKMKNYWYGLRLHYDKSNSAVSLSEKIKKYMML
jgi:hypothetical protein